MKDRIGNEIKVGSTVAYSYAGRAGFMILKVVKINNKMITLTDHRKKDMSVWPNHCIVVGR